LDPLLPQNTIYCEFADPEHFVEYYDLSVDPYNLHNLAAGMRNSSEGRAALAKMHARLLDHQVGLAAPIIAVGNPL
jgi:hypothetical protein